MPPLVINYGFLHTGLAGGYSTPENSGLQHCRGDLFVGESLRILPFVNRHEKNTISENIILKLLSKHLNKSK